jgi:DNA-binding FrmR family transcriptional regulator
VNGVQLLSVIPAETREDARKRLARINGQVSGLQKMIEEDRYCVDILTQVSALRAALDQFGLLMLSTHLENCVYGDDHEHGHEYQTKEERLSEIRVTLNRFLK